ncbi:alpha-(1,3)-fucosyltransferase 11-like [Anneissia japonica]|uniref:alpha-(1,3)-fucosyltransferase 11-like n=1 Tax=Anneissia japonica TaxID=1529436 RepID=UPI001425B6A9|nr:alpha-(1,3)-fucosyltransferase 11-like [Anneissia japonica]
MKNVSVMSSCFYISQIFIVCILHLSIKCVCSFDAENIVDDSASGPNKFPKFSSVRDILPVILWWTDSLFPHLEKDEGVIVQCPKSQCLATRNRKLLNDERTRAVMFYGTDIRAYHMPLPRKPWHEWCLLHEESPLNNYLLSHLPALKLFNHTATFREESDYPLTSQSIISKEYLLDRSPVPVAEKNRLRRGGLAPVLYVQSHCDVPSYRDRYVEELMKYIEIDSIGKCLNNKKIEEGLEDPVESMNHDNFHKHIAQYKFHIAFENAICDDYMTEKLFRPIHVGSVPVYLGSSRASKWMPSNQTLISVDEFSNPASLAEFLKNLDENDDLYTQYLSYKDDGITNQFLSQHLSNRPWGVNEPGQFDFITGFECYVCDKLLERIEVEKAHVLDPNIPLMDPKTAKYNHMGCPLPDSTFGGLLDEVITEDGFISWKEDYWSMLDQATALKQMILAGEKNSDKLFEYIERLHEH